MKILCFVLSLFLCISLLSAGVKNPDKPLKGEWDFNLKKVWEINRANDEPFAMPGELMVIKNGHPVFRDFMKNKSYIFTRSGKYINSFAQQGKNPGEVSRYLNRFFVEDKIVIGSPDNLHFFTEQGKFIKSFPNNLYECFPLHFINENEFLYGLGDLTKSPSGKEDIMRKNLVTGAETLFDTFDVEKSESSKGPSFVIFGLTPQFKMGFNPETGYFYYGKSNEYEIRVADVNGKRVTSFGLSRKKKKFSAEDKKKHFGSLRMPEERKKSLIASLPDELTYFMKIQVNKGLVYVFAVDEFDRHRKKQPIDMFSPKGKYLYSSCIKFEGDVVFANPGNMVFVGEYLYILYRENGKKGSLAKYRISLPPL